ncbi:cystatin-B-like [Ischnura elegans]|uniref:cystatin-B-like n=1 Tax=Ischnura elegans TaxID=197161 RepID=UPI001ED89790|nr:cystatin-B-like [Ischnura elegans]XP_046393551.1 cystatin-B-like [Ischnura elegans]XP_046393552.1 cystatin-B-like [Ischnura elegans]
MIVGGVGPTQAATPEVKEYVAFVRREVEEKAGRSFSEFEAKTFISQVVAGINYFVKVHIGSGEFLHLRLYKHFAKDVTLHSIQEGKTEADEISYF